MGFRHAKFTMARRTGAVHARKKHFEFDGTRISRLETGAA